MSDQKETSTAPLITLDDVLNRARKDLYQRARIDELEQTVDGLQDTLRADNLRHKETLAIVTQAAVRPPKAASPLVSELIAHYQRDRQAAESWTPATRNENLAIYKLFVDIVGDLPVDDINEDRALTFIETLKKVPANMNKVAAYRGKTIDEVIALHPKPISARTFNKYVERISSLFKFAMSKPKYDLRYNPFSGRSLDDSRAKKREPFTVDELLKLFGAAEHAQRKYKSAYSY